MNAPFALPTHGTVCMNQGVRPTWGQLLLFVGGLIVCTGTVLAIRSACRIANLDYINAAANDGINEHQPYAWPQWMGPNRDAVSLERNMLSSWPDQGLKVVWKAQLGPGYSSVVVAKGRAVTMTHIEGHEVVVCYNADNGKLLWRRAYPADYAGMDSRFNDGPRSTPTIEGDHVYTVGATGVFICWNLRDGDLVWRHDLQSEFEAKTLNWGVSFSPLVLGDVVYAQPGGKKGSIAAFDKRTGEVIWAVGSEPASYSSPIRIHALGREQLLFFTPTRLVSVSSSDGSEYWSIPWETDYDLNIPTPLFVDGDIFISTGYGRGCARVRMEQNSDGTLTAKAVYKSKRPSNQFTNSVHYNGHIYGFDRTEGHLICLDYATGKEKWNEARLGLGSLMVADGKLIIVFADGRLSLVEATPEEYRSLSTFQFSAKNQVWAAPSLANGKLYVRDSVSVVCYDVVE